MRRVNSLSDVQIVLNELLDWKNNQISKAKDQRGLQIKNGGDATDPTDLPTFRQLTEGLKKRTFIDDAKRAAENAQIFSRTLLIKDTATGDNIADNVTVQASGKGIRIAAVLRTEIVSDLVVRVNKDDTEVAVLTMPAALAVRTEMEIPITEIQFTDKEILTWDILASDGSVEANGVASVTVEWQGQ